MTRGVIATAFFVSCLLTAPSSARAGGDTFAELVVGLAVPQGDDGYDGLVDSSLLLGARLGSQIAGDRKMGLALEVSLAWQLLAVEDIPGIDEGLSSRIRATGGGRLYFDIQRDIRIFGRLGVGIDYVDLNGEIAIIGTDLGTDDLGLLVEPGGGLLVDLGRATLGFQFAVPVAMHDVDELDDDESFDLDYTSTDLDLLFTLSGPL